MKIRHTVARFISTVSSPELTLCGTLLYLEYVRWESLIGTLWIALYAALSLFIVYFGHRNGWQESRKKKLSAHGRNNRIIAFGLTLGSLTIPFVQAFYFEDWFIMLYLTVVAMTTAVLLITTITQNRKISAHVTFTGILFLYIIPSWMGLLLSLPFMVLVGWSRLSLHHHTLRQVLAALAMTITFFCLFLVAVPYVL